MWWASWPGTWFRDGSMRTRRTSATRGHFCWAKPATQRSARRELNTGQAIDPRQGIAATTFYDQIKRFFEDCASVLRGQGDAKGVERFTKASTHWMRHSHASHAIAGGMPIEIAQQNPGACVARHHDDLRHHREAAAHEGG